MHLYALNCKSGLNDRHVAFLMVESSEKDEYHSCRLLYPCDLPRPVIAICDGANGAK